jgi:hypothetical protein
LVHAHPQARAESEEPRASKHSTGQRHRAPRARAQGTPPPACPGRPLRVLFLPGGTTHLKYQNPMGLYSYATKFQKPLQSLTFHACLSSGPPCLWVGAPMAKLKDLTSQRFGRLVVLREAGRDVHGCAVWLCRCDCGGPEKRVRAPNLKSGRTRSCGCLLSEARRSGRQNLRHGRSKTTEYIIWLGMRARCYNVKGRPFKWYGGRGITVCERWRYSFENFFADMGPRPSPEHSIDRIDNDGNYEPGNCRWALWSVQVQNRPASYRKHGA